MLAGGGYAEYVVAPLVQCLPIPQGFSAIEAAALPENYFTVWSNVFDRGRLGHGEGGDHESLLVQGGSSGIGVTAIQLAHALDLVPHAAQLLVEDDLLQLFDAILQRNFLVVLPEEARIV